MPKNLTLSVVLSITLLLTLGCGDSGPKLVPVSGTVTVDGEPLTMGSVMLSPIDGRPAFGKIDSEGRFTLTTYTEGDGAEIGEHRVSVNAIEILKGKNAQRYLVPEKYGTAASSGITKSIVEPTQDLTIELTWEGGKPFVKRFGRGEGE